MSAPSLLALPFSHWNLTPGILCVSPYLALLYGSAARRAARWPARRTLSFLAGLAVIEVALQSGLDTYDTYLLSAHMLQHLMLIELGPALLLYGRPVHLALRTLPAGRRRGLGRALVRARRFLSPAVCVMLYALIVLGTHVPVVFDAALTHRGLHDLQHGVYVLAGLLIWWPLLGDPRPTQRMGVIGRLIYVTVAMLPMTVIGAYLDRDQSLFYPAYAAPARALGISALTDQQQAGAIMWVAGTALMGVVGVMSAVAGMVQAERRQRARELHGVTP